jgi:hypothetical protein
MSDHKKERDEFIDKECKPLNDFRSAERSGLRKGANWSHARSAKEIEELKSKCDFALFDLRVETLQNQLTQCHAMIEVLGDGFKLIENLAPINERERRTISRDMLQSLSEFKKSINEGVK